MPAVSLTQLPSRAVQLAESVPGARARTRWREFVAHELPRFLSSLRGGKAEPGRTADPWLEIITRFLHTCVFWDRPVCIIADGRRSSGWPYLDDALTGSTELQVDGYPNLIAFFQTGSPDLFRRAVYSGDFHWDAVWFAPLDGTDLAGVAKLIEGVRFPDPLSTPESEGEVVIPTGDGTIVSWFKPNRPFEDVAVAAGAITASFGWECKLASPEPAGVGGLPK